MRLAMRLPPKKGDGGTPADIDPREGESAEIIDLASRNGFSAVAERRTKTEGLGLAAGVALVGLLGAVPFCAMTISEVPEPQGVGGQSQAPAPAAAQPVADPEAQPVPGPAVLPQPDPAPTTWIAPTCSTPGRLRGP